MRFTLFQSALITSALSIAMAGIATATPPKKPNLAQFNTLIDRSPFTIKPAPTQPGGVTTPLERDWMLGSIRPSGNGWSVTLINKKDRKERIRLIPGFSAGDFQLLEVKQDPRSEENSRVHIRKGSLTGWITYDEKLIKVRPSVASKAPNPQPSASSSRGGPPIPGRSSSSAPTSRVRHVPRSGR
ncbi:MAG: hypothetical protein H7A51_10560 [Akkermansiaceae bacterium]|nr:hypothetical protein [Akkermansiaceae bacterium]